MNDSCPYGCCFDLANPTGVGGSFEVITHPDVHPGIDLGALHAAVEYEEGRSDGEDEVYYYHSDHLGSASWITDGLGTAVQHLQYLPYGEPFVNQRTAGYGERFTFTGKERDEETGYGYFGARYMDHELMTSWLSVDPMADKYPGISPYAYCAWNPVKLVDPDGREIDPSCIDEWNQRKNEIDRKRNELLVYSLAYKNTGIELFSQYSADYEELSTVLTVMGEMEESDQMYKLIHTNPENNAGDTYLQGNTINVEYSSTALLVHELVHCGQFERKEIGFSTNRRGGFTDYWDELSAYQAQAAYDMNSLPRNQYPELTIAWLTSIQKTDGSFPYRNIGKVPYGGDSDCYILNKAYPGSTFSFIGQFGSLPGTYFKSK